jgi:hypothetical protein
MHGTRPEAERRSDPSMVQEVVPPLQPADARARQHARNVVGLARAPRVSAGGQGVTGIVRTGAVWLLMPQNLSA